MQTTTQHLVTLAENTRTVGSSAYWGERGHWFIAIARTRDSDALDRSNFDCMKAVLKALPEVTGWAGDESPVAVERFSHWAVGWCDYLIVDPECAAAVAEAIRQRERLENYPILDEQHFGEVEREEANEVWRECYRPAERVAYIREHRGQFDFRDFADLLGCVRGKYFAGYASELLN